MHQLAIVFPILLVVWVMLIGVRIGAYLDKKSGKNLYVPTMEKFCPPHRWSWEDQPGMENVCYMRCQRCMKTPRQITDGT